MSTANAGDASAAYLLAKTYELSEKNFTLAAYWYQKSAEAGYLSAQFTLGQLFASYTNVVPHNKKLAVFCLRKSADRHHPEAGNELNQCLRNGYVSNNRRSEALEYRKDVELRHAHFAKKILLNDAQLGIFESRYHYGMISLSAKGVMRDEPQKFNTTLRADTLTDNKKRLLFLNQLMTQETRSLFRRFFLNKSTKRDFDLNMEIADHVYSYLSQFLTLHVEKKQLEEMFALLIKLLKTIPDTHSRYAEAEFILSHVSYMRNDPTWKNHFETCRQHDTEKKWVDLESIPARIRKNTLRNYKNSSREEQRELKRTALKQVGENKLDLQALFKLSLISPKRRAHCEASIRVIDPESPFLQLCMAR